VKREILCINTYMGVPGVSFHWSYWGVLIWAHRPLLLFLVHLQLGFMMYLWNTPPRDLLLAWQGHSIIKKNSTRRKGQGFLISRFARCTSTVVAWSLIYVDQRLVYAVVLYCQGLLQWPGDDALYRSTLPWSPSIYIDHGLTLYYFTDVPR
jgi:hypothetical protein